MMFAVFGIDSLEVYIPALVVYAIMLAAPRQVHDRRAQLPSAARRSNPGHRRAAGRPPQARRPRVVLRGVPVSDLDAHGARQRGRVAQG